MNIKEKISKKHIIIGTSALVLIVGGITIGVIANNSDEQPANANVTETQPTTEQVTTTTTTNITTTITTTTTVTTTTMITTTKAEEQKKKEEANKKEESSSSSNNNYYEEPDYSYEEPDNSYQEPDNSYQEPVYQEPAYEEPAQSYDDGGEVSYVSDEELAATLKEQGFSDEEIEGFLNFDF